MDNRKKLLACGIAAVILLVVVAVVITHRTKEVQEECIPTNSKPDVSKIAVKTLTSEKGPLVANLAGYVELLSSNESSTYLPMNINQFHVSAPNDDWIRTITFEGPCVTFKMEYYDGFGLSLEQNILRKPEMSITNDLYKEGNGTAEVNCKFDNSFKFEMSTDGYYSNPSVIANRCSDVYGKPVAKLIMKSFQLDLGATPGSVQIVV